MAGRTTPPEQPIDGAGLTIPVVVARFHLEITQALLDGALQCFAEHNAPTPDVHWVPGSFELPLACKAIAETGAAQAIVALGCVIRGGTPHFDYVCAQTARGLMDVQLATDIPIAFGVLTTDDFQQAQARAGGSVGNKGYDAALVAMEMAHFVRSIPRDADMATPHTHLG